MDPDLRGRTTADSPDAWHGTTDQKAWGFESPRARHVARVKAGTLRKTAA